MFLLLSLLALPILLGCAGAPPAAIAGRDFLSTAISVDGAAKALVPGTRIRLSFRDGDLGASAGCNLMSGSYALAGGRLAVDGLGMTEMGCDPQRHAQDEWLAAFLTSGPTVSLEGDDLLLTGAGIAIRLADRRVADPDVPLVGTVWTVDSIIVFDGVSSVPQGVFATLQLRPDGGFDVATGCNQGSGRVTIDASSLRFSDLGLTRMACMGPAGEMEAHFLRILGADVAYRVDARSLTLQAGELGLVLRAD